LLAAHARFGKTFDLQFRRMLLAIYTADEDALNMVIPGLNEIYGERTVLHIYSGYCEARSIPNQTSVNS
jgi:hypothetical protein